MPAITPDRRLASLTEAANPLQRLVRRFIFAFFIGPQPDPVFDPFGHPQHMPWMYAAHFS
jgi:hypothetical protein